MSVGLRMLNAIKRLERKPEEGFHKNRSLLAIISNMDLTAGLESIKHEGDETLFFRKRNLVKHKRAYDFRRKSSFDRDGVCEKSLFELYPRGRALELLSRQDNSFGIWVNTEIDGLWREPCYL